jgi:hypothetical protein
MCVLTTLPAYPFVSNGVGKNGSAASKRWNEHTIQKKENRMQRPQNDQTTISALNSIFAGRNNDPSYDPTKTVHIHRRNRAYVWNDEMQRKCLDSILKGYYIPPIICNSLVVDGRIRREVMEGGNRITTFRRILENKVRPLTDAERRTVDCFPITLVYMENLTNEQQRDMFRRLNKNVRVTDGQLYAMSEEDSPLVQEALALLNDDLYPVRQRITDMFFDTRNVLDNDNPKNNLSASVALVSGAIHGAKFITRSFDRQESAVSSQDPIDRTRVVAVLTQVLDIFSRADALVELADGRRRRGQWALGTRLAPMLYDVVTTDDVNMVQTKWSQYLAKVRSGALGGESAVSVGSAKNLTPDLLKRICAKVRIYVDEDRLATDEELRNVRHNVVAGDPEEESTDGDNDEE